MEYSILSLFRNECFWAPLFSWLAAQMTKLIIGLYRRHRLDFSYLVSTGGMPSAHSALVCGLATATGLTVGFGSAIFAVSLAFALLVMFDASTVRYAAGMQARLLNEIVDELFKEHHLSETKLKELLGHTRLEVFMGMLQGILVGVLVHAVALRL